MGVIDELWLEMHEQASSHQAIDTERYFEREKNSIIEFAKAICIIDGYDPYTKIDGGGEKCVITGKPPSNMMELNVAKAISLREAIDNLISMRRDELHMG